MKQKLILFLVLAIALNTMAFAGGQKEAKSTVKGTTAISYAIWDRNQAPGMQAIIERFEELNPDIKVSLEVSTWSDYWTRLEAAATGGAMPDVFWMHANHIRKYAENNMLLPIGVRVKADPDLDYSNYPVGVTKVYEIGGVNYAIPKDFDTIGLCYNKRMFEAAGISYPDSSWDWNKLLDVAKQLTNESKGIYGFAAKASNQSGYYNIIYEFGGYVLNEDKTKSGFDQPETIEAIQFWHDLIHKHHVSPTIEQMADTKARNIFSSKKLAMYTMGSWRVTGLANNEVTKEVADIAVLPKMRTRASIYNGLGNSIAASTKHPEEAWRFVKFLGTKEANIIQAESGAAIPAFKGTQEPWFNFRPNFNLKAFVEMLDYGVPYPTSKTGPKWVKFESEMMLQILSGKVGVEEGCRQIAAETNKWLATEK